MVNFKQTKSNKNKKVGFVIAAILNSNFFINEISTLKVSFFEKQNKDCCFFNSIYIFLSKLVFAL